MAVLVGGSARQFPLAVAVETVTPSAGPGGGEAMAAGGGGPVSARALARSVARRLKYYIDVQRKEHSFDSSGLIRDEMESTSCYPNPACLTEWVHGWPLEHDFTEIKLEASLRAYTGSAKECYQKVQESPEKQKDLEKFIKERARDYVPDRTNKSRAKMIQRQSCGQRAPSSLHRSATPGMSAEEVRRLVSSASKLIVAATSEVSPKVLGTTQGVFSTPKRRATKTIPSLDCAWKQSLSSTRSHKDEAESIQECNEEFQTELNQKASENGGKKPRATKKRRNVKHRERPTEMSSNASRNTYKPTRAFSTVLPKSSDLCSVRVSFPSPYSPPGQDKVYRKGILKNRRLLSCTSPEISEYQNTEPDSRGKGSLQPPAGQSCKPLEIKRKKSSFPPIGMASRRRSSRASKSLARQPGLTSRSTPEVARNNTEGCAAEQTAEVMHAQSSKVCKKSGNNSKGVSGCAVLSGPGKEMRGQGNGKSELSGTSQRDWLEETKGDLSSASEKNSECHWHCPKNVEQKHNSDSCSLDNLRQPESATLPTASVDEPSEILACLQEDRDKDLILTVTCEPSLGHQICQGEDQEAPASLAMNESMPVDGILGNQDIKGHSGNLLNHILSLNEADAKATDDPTSHTQINDLILGDPWDQQVVYIPPMLLGDGEISEDGNGSSASSGMNTPVLGRPENKESNEEFTISSASSCFSSKSLASTEGRNTNGRLKEEEENADSSADIRVLNVTQESSSAQQGTFDQHSERRSSSAEAKRTNKDYGPENTSATQVVYFSHLPMSS